MPNMPTSPGVRNTDATLPDAPAVQQRADSEVAGCANQWRADSIRGRFVRGAAWSVMGTAALHGLSFLAYAVSARSLPKEAFGGLGIIQSTVGMLGALAGAGLGLTATRHVALFRGPEPQRAGRVIGITISAAVIAGGTAAAVLALLAPFLAAHTLKAPELAGALQIGCVLLFLNTVDGVQTGALTGFEAFPLIARTNVLRGVVTITLVAGGVLQYGLLGAIWGFVTSAGLGLAINHVALRREAKRAGIAISYRGMRAEAPVLWRYSFPAFVSVAAVAPAAWMARALLAGRPGGFAELAVFTVASRFQDVVSLAGQTVGSALLPLLASERGARSAALGRGNIVLSWVLGAGLVVPVISFPEIVVLFFGPQYASRAAMQTLVLTLCATGIVMYKQGLARVLAAKSLMWWGALSNATWAVVFVGSSWILLNDGARGVALALLVAYVLNTAIFMPLYVRRDLAPRAVLISRSAVLVWIVILGASMMSFFGAPLWARAAMGAGGLLVLYAAFRRLVRPDGVGASLAA